MSQAKRVTRNRKIGDLKASGEEASRLDRLLADIESQRKPGKKLVRLQLDADLLAWFKEPGPGVPDAD
jgi:uncharacterized protein (DUF4415 family)